MPLRLDIDHKDGDPLNNKLDNLQFICPNCHRQKTTEIPQEITKIIITKNGEKTVTVREQPKLKPNKEKNCPDCNIPIYFESQRCKNCARKHLRKKSKLDIV